MDVAEDPDVKRWRLTVYSRTRHFGEDDPRTAQARRELMLARIAVAEAEAARWRAELAVLDGAAA